MDKIIKLLTAVVVGSFFIFMAAASRAQVLISQVMPENSSASDEFVELYNYSSSSVSLSGWNLKRIYSGDKSQNLVTSFSSTSTIVPFGYFLIGQSGYSLDNIVTLDYLYSTQANLAKDNNAVALFDESDSLIDLVAWGSVSSSVYNGNTLIKFTEGVSAVRLPNTDEGNGLDTDDCSNDFVFNNESLPRNRSSPSRPVWPPIETPISTSETPTTTPPDPVPPAIDTSTIWAQIKINEFVSDPESGNEWVELFNPSTSSLDLAGGWICDSRGITSTYMCKSATGTISAGGWLYVDLLTASYLNNTGDYVILKNSSGEIIDRIDYGADLISKKNQALARKIDGVDSDSPVDWAITTQLTSGAANIIVAPVVINQSSGGGSSSPQTQPVPVVEVANRISYGVFINEIYPNPSGSDTDGEFIEIKNISNSTIDLSGWKIGDTVKTFNLFGTVFPGQIIFWPRTLTKIFLNNTTKETVKLFNEKSEIVDAIEYDWTKEGESYCRGMDAKWSWSAKPTAGLENEIIQSDGEIILKINAPSGGEVGEMLVFDAEDSADRRGGELNFVWHFSDGAVLSGGEVEKAFSTSGVFVVLISATSTSGSSGSKTVEIIIGSGLSVYNTGIIISEILSNPAGDDSGEFIEIYNSGESAIDLSGWRLRRQSGQEYIFPVGTKIQQDGYLVFNRAATRFSLNNQGDKIELLTRDLQTVDLIKFGAGPSGKSYSLFEDGWQWTTIITSGQINQTEDDLFGDETSGKGNEIEIFVTLAEARLLEIGEKVRTRGIVTVLPGIFGVQFFYLGDENGGIQIYNYKKDFPPLKIGDYLEVAGEISVSQNIKRIKIKDSQAIDILELEKFLGPQDAVLSDLQEEKLGGLIKITGEITEIKTNGMYVDDGQDEIMVYFKKGAKINKKQFQEGANVSVSGILEEKSGDFQLWPRSMTDLESIGLSDEFIKKGALTAAGGNGSKKKAENYLTATIGGLTALLLGFVGRAKGVVLKTFAKKTGLILLGFIVKKKG